MVSRHFCKFIFIVAVSFFCLFGTSLYAQQVEISSTLNPVGSGARATGMGGAFIGVADDATAASWNPAGLIQLERPEISAVYSYFDREQSYNSSVNPEIASRNKMDADGLNYASAVFPFVLFNRNMVVSLNYQRLFEMDKSVAYNFNRVVPTVDNNLETNRINFTQDGFLYTISPAMAVQVVPQLYLGATLNFWDNLVGENGWDNRYVEVGQATMFNGFLAYTRTTTQTQDISFEGTNGHLGFMWLINDSLTLGGVYKTSFDADIIRNNYSVQNTIWLPKGIVADQFDPPVISTENLVMKMPASYGLGLAFRHSDSLTVSFDLYRTEWSEFVIVDALGNETNPLTSLPASQGELGDTTQVRFGTEYLFIGEKYVVPVRAGLFYDPEPVTNGTDDYYGFSVGTGIASGRVVIDMSYQFRMGDGVTADLPGITGASADIDQHAVMFSAIFYIE